jgi:hypothetical protein
MSLGFAQEKHNLNYLTIAGHSYKLHANPDGVIPMMASPWP